MQAAGLIVYRRVQSVIEFLLLQTSYGKHHWTPPKGHLDDGEDALTAAVRETEEEAGLRRQDYDVESTFHRTLSYFDSTKKQNKSVHYWLAKIKNPEHPIKLSHEHQDHKWVAVAEACRLSEHADMGELLKEADGYIDSSFSS